MTVRLASGALFLCSLPAAAPAQVARPETAPVPTPSASRRDAATLTVSTTVSAGSSSVGRSSPSDAQTSDTRLNSDLQASFNYGSAPGGLFSWQLSAGTGARRQKAVDRFVVLGHTAGGGVGFSLGKRTSVQLSQSVGYVPSYYLAAGPSVEAFENVGQLPAAAVDFSLASRPAYVSGSGVSVTERLSARSSVSATYGLNRTDYVDPEDPSLKGWNAGARYQYQIVESLGVHVGYGRRSGEYSNNSVADRSFLDDVDIGVDFNRPFSIPFARRTTLRFSTGSTISQAGRQPRRYGMTGNASLNQAFGRSGTASLSFNRGVSLVQGFMEPVFADSLTLAAGGRLRNRLDLRISAALALGNVGANADQSKYRNYTGSGRLTFKLTSRSSLFATYLYSRHDIGAGVERIATLPGAQAQQSGRVGFSMRVPVIQQWVRPREGN